MLFKRVQGNKQTKKKISKGQQNQSGQITPSLPCNTLIIRGGPVHIRYTSSDPQLLSQFPSAGHPEPQNNLKMIEHLKSPLQTTVARATVPSVDKGVVWWSARTLLCTVPGSHWGNAHQPKEVPKHRAGSRPGRISAWSTTGFFFSAYRSPGQSVLWLCGCCRFWPVLKIQSETFTGTSFNH